MVNPKKISFIVSSFRFVSQRSVKFKSDGRFRFLSKSDVIQAINFHIWRIHQISDKPIRSEGINYHAFKMHDLVPYLFTLINLYLSLRCSPLFIYHRWLPELKITRFCHLPFEDEIIIKEIPLKEIECACLANSETGVYCYVALVGDNSIVSSCRISDMRDKLQSLFPCYRVVLKVVGS